LFLFLSLSCGSPQGFIGQWLDNFGWTHNLCVTHNQTRLEGSYNNFGIIQGDIVSQTGTTEKETVRGNWFEAWYVWNPNCRRGDFIWHINGNDIIGNYTCFDDLQGGYWNLTKISPQVNPTNEQCLVLGTVSNAAGHWKPTVKTDSLDICLYDNNTLTVNKTAGSFEASYDVITGDLNNADKIKATGYVFGQQYLNGRVLQGSYITQLSVGAPLIAGGCIFIYRDNDTLTLLNYRAPYNVRDVQESLGLAYYYREVPRITTVTANVNDTYLCDRNSRLNPRNYIKYHYDQTYVPPVVSIASSLVISFFFIVASLLTAF